MGVDSEFLKGNLKGVLTDILANVGGQPNDGQTSFINKFGVNQDIDLATDPEDIWTVGGLYPFATFNTAQTLEVVSTSANDDDGGSGANTMTVQGLDDNLEEQEETITLDGTSAVTLSGTWKAVNRMFVNTTGATGYNEGNINCQVSGGGQVVSQIAFRLALLGNNEGKNQTEQAIYRVPAGKKAMLKYATASALQSITVQAVVEIKQVLSDATTIRTKATLYTTELNSGVRDYKVGGIEFTAGQWIAMRVQEVSADNTKIAGEFDLILTDA